MKLEIQKNLIVAHAETVEESLQLIGLAHGGVKKEVVEKKKKYKKHAFTKVCEVCGQKCKGNIGLAVHKARMHEGKHWVSNGKPTADKPGLLDEWAPRPQKDITPLPNDYV